MTAPDQAQPEQEPFDPERVACSESTMLLMRERQLTEAMREAGVARGAALEARSVVADLQGRLQRSAEEWQTASAAWLAAQGEYESEIARLNARINELLEAAETDAQRQVVDGEVVLPEPVEDALPAEPVDDVATAVEPTPRKRPRPLAV